MQRRPRSRASMASDPSSALNASLDALELIETLTDRVLIEGASLNQDEDEAGNQLDEVDVYWRLTGRPGIFTSRVPFLRNWPAIAFYYIGVKQALVQAIYDGLPNKAALPGGVI